MNKWLAPLVWIVFASCFTAIPAGAEEKEKLFVIHQIVVDPQDSKRVFSATSNYGILETRDGGTTWEWSNEGLQSYTHRAIAFQPDNPGTLYVGGWGGGVSKSLDRGAHWSPMNNELGNTAIEDIAIDSNDPKMIFVATTTGVFKSSNGAGEWKPYSSGLPVSEIENYECLLFVPVGETELLLGTSQGLFKKRKGRDQWEPVTGPLRTEHISSLAVDQKTGFLYVGTIHKGLLGSPDGGKTWQTFGGLTSKTWVSDIGLDPKDSGIIYIATRGKGVLKSRDHGSTWQEMNRGLPTQDIRCVSLASSYSDILYAGTTDEGIVKTEDGGKSWIRMEGYPLMTVKEIIASISVPKPPAGDRPDPTVPAEFFKCNQCHGWTDPLLNSKTTYWRVPANRRNWTTTVDRMGGRARLTKAESAALAKFLNAFSQTRRE